MEIRSFLILLLAELLVFLILWHYCRERLKLYRLDFYEGEFVQWVIAYNRDHAVEVYNDNTGMLEEDMDNYFEYVPEDNINDFYDHCITAEPDHKVFPYLEEDGTLIESKTVKEWIKETGRPCYFGASEC